MFHFVVSFGRNFLIKHRASITRCTLAHLNMEALSFPAALRLTNYLSQEQLEAQERLAVVRDKIEHTSLLVASLFGGELPDDLLDRLSLSGAITQPPLGQAQDQLLADIATNEGRYFETLLVQNSARKLMRLVVLVA